MRFFLLIVTILFCTAVSSWAQQCTGTRVFTQKDCDGDSFSDEERRLHDLMNAYRISRGRKPVSQSDSLTWLANRHLLDVRFNLKQFTHSWSDCRYDPANQSTWPCMTDSARRLKTGFEGDTFETLFAASGAAVDPKKALDYWTRSALHNSIILNQGMFAGNEWEEVGIAISGNYAALWFGAKAATSSAGIGTTYQKAVSGLSGLVAVKPAGANRWTGTSKDGKISIDLLGPRANLSEATMTVSAALEKDGRPGPASRRALLILLKNIFPEWGDAETWLNESVNAVLDKKQPVRTKIIRKTLVRLSHASGSIRLLFTPENASRVREIF